MSLSTGPQPGWGPTASVPPAEGRYVVHTDRHGLNRLYGGILTLHAVLLVLVLGLMFWLDAALGEYLGWFSLLPLGILVLGQCFQSAVHSFAWGRRGALFEPMVIEPQGFTMTTVAGKLEVPWAAVTSVTIRRAVFGRFLTIGVHPEFLAAGPPPGTSFSRRQWRFVQRRGLVLGSKGLQESLDDISAAMSWFARSAPTPT